MRGKLLDVEEGVSAGPEVFDKVKDRGFSRVGPAVKHGFSGEDGSGVDPVETADELVLCVPDFDAVGEAQSVSLCVGPDHFRVNPGLPSRGFGAGADDVLERGVEGDAVAGFGELSAGAFANVKPVKGEDPALKGADPGEEVGIIPGPGENSQRIGGQERLPRHA